MNRRRVSTFLFATAMFVTQDAGLQPVRAQEDGSPVAIGVYRVIDSKILGEKRRLLIHLPRGYEGSAIRYPVLYHTYGDYISQYYADAFSAVEKLGGEARTPPMILVGIDNIDRYRDLRPARNDGSPGGAGRYTRFLTEEVFPFVESHYRTADYRIAAGPQAGAVFCLYALQNHPDLFDAFIANNPLVHAPSNELLLAQAEAFYQGPGSLGKVLFITYGGVGDSSDRLAALERYAELTAPARGKGFLLHLNKLEGNDDFVPPLGLTAGLRALFGDYHVPDPQRFRSLEEIRAFYGGLSKRYGYDVALPEFIMTRAADGLLERGEIEAAVRILEHQTTLYPSMVNAWWRLAGVAAGHGEIEKAIELYEKCVELNPGMRNFVTRRIAELKAETGG
jgi:predicted alpha/beta superfamily hydrolase